VLDGAKDVSAITCDWIGTDARKRY
jgi:hypothetical protein